MGVEAVYQAELKKAEAAYGKAKMARDKLEKKVSLKGLSAQQKDAATRVDVRAAAAVKAMFAKSNNPVLPKPDKAALHAAKVVVVPFGPT